MVRSLTMPVFVALGVGALLPAPARAQIVTGGVYDATTSAPLSGVLISLLDGDDERIGAVLSDDTGRFVLDVGRFGRFRIRAERIGLQTTLSDSFELFSTNPHSERILMGDRAVQIEGLVVDSRLKQCRIDPGEAVQIQRWWREIRTALDVSAAVQNNGLARFSVERFDRTWDAELKRVLASDSRSEMSLSNRPFASADAQFLADGGFVQGEVTGQREYYAPDADVLLSDVFLGGHCFSISESRDDRRLVGLSFEPAVRGDVPDIEGTLWVDSTTAELQNLDFRYTDLESLPPNESGGYVAFEYMASGAWVVRDWFIRMPRIALQRRRNRDEFVVVGYVDVGGRVRPVETAPVTVRETGPSGRIHGMVYDSIHGRGLAGATVEIFGTGHRSRTDAAGAFVIENVPVGERRLTFFHDDTEAWGLGLPLTTVEVDAEVGGEVRLALPGFRQAARVVCLGSGMDADAVLTGHVVDGDDRGLGNVTLQVAWELRESNDRVRTRTQEARTGSDGRFVVCTLPSEVVLTVRMLIDDRWIDAFGVTLPHHDIVYRRVTVPTLR